MTEFWQMQRNAALSVMDFMTNPEFKRVSRELADLRDSKDSNNLENSDNLSTDKKEEIKQNQAF